MDRLKAYRERAPGQQIAKRETYDMMFSDLVKPSSSPPSSSDTSASSFEGSCCQKKESEVSAALISYGLQLHSWFSWLFENFYPPIDGWGGIGPPPRPP
jgi:hypothetical protein